MNNSSVGFSRPVPSSVAEAADCLAFCLPSQVRRALAVLPEQRLPEVRRALGGWMKIYFGLWDFNDGLNADTGAVDAEGAYSVVCRAAWLRLNTSLRAQAEIDRRVPETANGKVQ